MFFLKSFFTQLYFKYSYQIQILFRVMWFIDWALTGTTTLGQSEPGSNSNEGVFHTPKSPEWEPYYQLQFRVIPRTLLFRRFSIFSKTPELEPHHWMQFRISFEGILPLCIGYSHCILSFTERAVFFLSNLLVRDEIKNIQSLKIDYQTLA